MTNIMTLAPHVEGETIARGQMKLRSSWAAHLSTSKNKSDYSARYWAVTWAILPLFSQGCIGLSTEDLAFVHYTESLLRQRNQMIQRYIDEGMAQG